MRHASIACAGALAAALAAGCGAGDSASLEDVANAAEVTSRYSGVRMTMTMTTRVPGVPGSITTTGAGTVDNRLHRGYMTVDMTDLRREAMAGIKGAAKRLGPPQDWRGEQMIDFSRGRAVTYMRVPFMSRVLKTRKAWIKLDFQRLGEQAGIDFQQFLQLGDANPTQAVDFLRAVSGKVHIAGHEPIRGVDTTHYRVTIDLEKYPSLVPPRERQKMRQTINRLTELTGVKTVPSNVWIGNDGAVRKMEYVYTMQIPDQRTGKRLAQEMVMTMELYDFGATVNVDLPSKEDVFDLSSAIEAK